MNYVKHIRQYKINSIFVKNFIAAFCVVLIPIFIINVLTFSFYHTKSLEENCAFAENELNFVQDSVDKVFKWVNSNCNYMINDVYVTSFLQNGFNHTDIAESFLIANVVQNQLQRIKLYDPCIESIHLYSIKSNYILSTDGSGTPDMFCDKTIKESIKQQTVNNKISQLYNENGRKIIRNQISLNSFGIDIGIIFVNIDYDILKTSITKNISDENNIVVFTSNEQPLLEFGTEIDTGYSISKSSDDTGFKYSSTYQNTINLIPIMLLVLLISFIFVLAAALFLTYKACSPINSIMDIMEDAESWYIQKDKLPLAGEARYILENYLDRIYYSKEIELDLKDRIAELRKSQIEALNLQIKPHFLFNTLQSISMCAMNLTNSENDAVIGIEMLSEIFKYSLNSNGYLDTVENELAFTKAYVGIQKLKYNGRVNVLFQVDESVLSNKTAKIVIQPLIENSYSHGILPFKDTGEITVKIYGLNNRLVIEVIDDGAGMNKETLKKVKSYLQRSEIITGEHIGLSNVDRKIKLIFGEEYGLRIDCSYTKGTRIIIEQPL